MKRAQLLRIQAFFLALALSAAHAEAVAANIISDVTTTRYYAIDGDMTNASPVAERTVTVRCGVEQWGSSLEPFQVTNADGNVVQVSVECSRLVDYYAGTLVGYIPPTGQLHEAEICTDLLLGDNDHVGDYLLLTKLDTTDEILADQAQASEHRMRLQDNTPREPEKPRAPPPHVQRMRDRIIREWNPPDTRGENGMALGPQGYTTLPTFGGVLAVAATTGLALAVGSVAIPLRLTATLLSSLSTIATTISLASRVASTAGMVGAAVGVVLQVISTILTIIDLAKGNSFQRNISRALTQLGTAITDVDSKSNALTWSLINYQDASLNYFRSLRDWQGNVTQVIGELYQGVQDSVTLIGKVQTNLQDVISIQQQSLAAQAAAIDTIQQQTSLIAGRTTQLSGHVDTLASLIIQSAQAGTDLTQQVYGAVQQVANATKLGFDSVRDAMNYTSVDIDSTIRRLVGAISVVNAAVIDTAQDKNMLQSLTYLVQSHIVKAKLNFTTDYLTPFLSHYGAEPDIAAIRNADGLTDSYFVLDSISLFQIDATGSGRGAHYDTIAMECAASYIIQSTISATTWRDVMENIGPTVCATPNVNTTVTCRCRMRIRERACTLATPTTASAARTAFLETRELGAEQCEGGLTPATSLRIVYDSTKLIDYFKAMCGRGIYPGSHVFVGSTIQGQGSRTTIMPEGCSMDFGVVQSTQVNGMSAPYIFFQYALFALGNGALRASALSYLIYGLMPGGMTYTEIPAENDDGNVRRCKTAAFMSYDLRPSRLLPVIAYTRTRSAANAVVTVDGVSGQMNTEIIVGSRSAAVVDAFRSVGFPYDNTVVYNIDPDDIPIGNNPKTRAASVTYPMMPPSFRETLNATNWRKRNRLHFDAYDGSVVADQYAYYVSPLTGQCTTPVSSAAQLSTDGANTPCRMRQRGAFNPIVTGTSDILDVGYTPNEVGLFYDVAVTFPAGSISSLLYTMCPTIDIVRTSPIVTVVVFTNSANVAINFVVEIAGACPSRTELSMPAGATYRYNVYTCASASGSVTSTLVVKRLMSNGLEAATACEGSNVDVSVNRTAYILNEGGVDQQWVVTSSQAVANAALLASNENTRVLLQLATRLTGFVLDLSRINGLSFPALNTSGIDAVISGATDLIKTNDKQAKEFASSFASSEANLTAISKTIDALRNTSRVLSDAAYDDFWKLFNTTQSRLVATGGKVLTIESLDNRTAFLELKLEEALINLTKSQIAYNEANVNALRRVQDTFFALSGGGVAAGVGVFTIICLLCCLYPFINAAWRIILRKAGWESFITGGNSEAPAAAPVPIAHEVYQPVYAPHDYYGNAGVQLAPIGEQHHPSPAVRVLPDNGETSWAHPSAPPGDDEYQPKKGDVRASAPPLERLHPEESEPLVSRTNAGVATATSSSAVLPPGASDHAMNSSHTRRGRRFRGGFD